VLLNVLLRGVVRSPVLLVTHLLPLACCHSLPALLLAQVIKTEAHVVHLLDGADLLRLLWAYRVVRHRDALLHKRLVDRAVTQVGRRGMAGLTHCV
jgi:hypothetical protein